MKVNNILVGVLIVSFIFLIGLGGWQLHKTLKPCPEITRDTIIVPDTTWHKLEDSLKLSNKNLQSLVNYWKKHRDTIYLPGEPVPYPVPIDVDTTAILKDYFSLYKYGWSKENDTISVRDSVYITQNTPVKHVLDYKINKPFTTIINNVDNSITYNKYIQFGLDMPVYAYDSSKVNIMNLKLDLDYVFPKGSVGIGWQPNTETIYASAKVTLFKFKQKK